MAPFASRFFFFQIGTLIWLQGVFISNEKVQGNPITLRNYKEFDSRGSHVSESKSRQKRCTCYSYTDKECVYYCHLDIIWINTPERTVPYGMSSYRGQQRRRRAADERLAERDETKKPRCVCAVADDPHCHKFCVTHFRRNPSTKHLPRVSGPG